MTVAIMIIVFVVSMLTAAWVVPRKRAARKDREAADDAAIKDVYGHYLVGIDALTQAYLLRAPSDEEWLAGIRARAGKPGTARRLEVPACLRAAMEDHLLAYLLAAMAGCLEDRRSRGWRHVSAASVAVISGAGIAIAVAYAVVRLAEWSLPSLLGIAVIVTLGSLAGRVIGLRQEVPVEWWRRKT